MLKNAAHVMYVLAGLYFVGAFLLGVKVAMLVFAGSSQGFELAIDTASFLLSALLLAAFHGGIGRILETWNKG